MPIKIEILADTTSDLMAQLRGLLAGGGSPPVLPLSIGAGAQGTQATLAAELVARQEAINQAPGGAPETKAAAKTKTRRVKFTETGEKANGGGIEFTESGEKSSGSRVKPLPENDDPLADDLPFDPPPADMTPEQVIAAAVSKLRDLHAKPAGQAAIRALREKYQIQFLHEVPAGRADELMADALRIEKEISA